MQNHPRTLSVAASAQAMTLTPLLISLSRSTRQMLQLKLAEIGLAVGQDQFLDLLTVEESIPVSVFAQKLNVRPSTTSKMTDRLAVHGWVVREGDGEDSRRTLLRLTPAGLEMQAKIREVWAQLDRELSSSLADPNKHEAVAATLEQITNVLGGRLSRLR